MLHDSSYKGMTTAELSCYFQMEDSASFTELLKYLNELEGERLIARDSRERYFLSSHLGYVTGTLRVNPKDLVCRYNGHKFLYCERGVRPWNGQRYRIREKLDK